jgi:hypothetical protein
MKRIALGLIVALVVLFPTFAMTAREDIYSPSERYVPLNRGAVYSSVNDFFTDKYGERVTIQDRPKAQVIIDPLSGQPYSYTPYADYGYGRMTQNSYYQIENPQLVVDIAEGSYDDGYNYGYFSGYPDGVYFQRYGYEGYFDYVEAMKTKYDPNKVQTGYYRFNRRDVKITVSSGSSSYNKGYAEGILAGFKDGYYDVEYNGLNKEYYAFKEFQKENPGVYQPIVYSQIRPSIPFRSYQYYQSYATGRMLYGFNY